jgi:uncharacterized membrane protein
VAARLWPPALLVVVGWSFAASAIWQLVHLPLVYGLVLRPTDGGVRALQEAPRKVASLMLAFAMVGAAAHTALILWRVRRGRYRGAPYGYWLPVASVGLPVLLLPLFEYEHPYLAGLAVLGLAAALAHVTGRLARARGLAPRDLSPRAAWIAVGGAFVLFVAVIGFLSQRRLTAFYAHPYDFSWEMNAVAGILRHGIPTISEGADYYYPHRHLPAPYFDLHAPLIYYLYAPLYALHRDPRTMVWLQAAFMGSGAFGVYLVGRRWFRHRGLAVLAAFAYVLNPQVQGYCLHDLHANILAIPLMMLALGFMEAGRPRAALVAALLIAVCREETGLYAATVGVYWLLSNRGDRARFWTGAVTMAASVAILVLMTKVLMPAFGGEPRVARHFDLFFDGMGPPSLAKALLLNPLGVVNAGTAAYRMEYVWLSFLPMGLLALRGGRAAWSLLPAVPLLLASSNPDFYSNGINYGAPITPPAILMGMMGMRSLLLSRRLRRAYGRGRRLPIAVYVGVCVLVCNVLYGNIGSKSYKLEYGGHPVRENEYRYHGNLGVLSQVPAFGARERGIWEAIHHVPRGAPIATSWLLNAPMSNRDIAFVYPYMGQANEESQRARYVIIDKLPPLIDATDRYLDELHRDPAWAVEYENRYAAVFRRR